MFSGENIDGGVVHKAAVDDDNATREMLVFAPRRGNKEQAGPDTLWGCSVQTKKACGTVCQPLSRVVSHRGGMVRCIAAAAR
jgi:hypothetical protein